MDWMSTATIEGTIVSLILACKCHKVAWTIFLLASSPKQRFQHGKWHLIAAEDFLNGCPYLAFEVFESDETSWICVSCNPSIEVNLSRGKSGMPSSVSIENHLQKGLL